MASFPTLTREEAIGLMRAAFWWADADVAAIHRDERGYRTLDGLSLAVTLNNDVEALVRALDGTLRIGSWRLTPSEAARILGAMARLRGDHHVRRLCLFARKLARHIEE